MEIDVPRDFQDEFIALARDTTLVPLETTRYRLWCLMATIQLASRHPEAAQTEPVKVAMEMARHLQAIIATAPALARVAEQGWDQTKDR